LSVKTTGYGTYLGIIRLRKSISCESGESLGVLFVVLFTMDDVLDFMHQKNRAIRSSIALFDKTVVGDKSGYVCYGRVNKADCSGHSMLGSADQTV
jgi:hypothetical protein